MMEKYECTYLASKYGGFFGLHDKLVQCDSRRLVFG